MMRIFGTIVEVSDRGASFMDTLSQDNTRRPNSPAKHVPYELLTDETSLNLGVALRVTSAWSLFNRQLKFRRNSLFAAPFGGYGWNSTG